MESDIKRWTAISSYGHTYPGQRHILVARNKSPSRSSTSKSRYAAHSQPRLRLRKMHQDRSQMSEMLDRLAADQRKDMQTVWSGYLNPDVTNRKYRQAEAIAAMKHAAMHAGRKSSASAEESKAVLASFDRKQETSGLDNSGTPPEHQTAHNITDLHDILEQYDVIKHQGIAAPSPTAAASERFKPQTPPPHPVELPAHIRGRVLPLPQLTLTKNDAWKTYQEIDGLIDRKHWMHRQGGFAKQDRLNELHLFIQQELEAVQAPPTGPDFQRLQVYSAAFDKLIPEFKLYGPLLGDIKNEYDKTISNFSNDQRELGLLRTKVQKLLSQNENRLLLKYERRKCKQLEKRLQELGVENFNLREDLQKKLAIYAAYLPSSVLERKKKEDSDIADIADEIKSFKIGEDPVSLFEKKVATLEAESSTQKREITTLRKAQAEDFVPKTEKEAVDAALKSADEKLTSLKEQHAKINKELTDQKSEFETVATTLKDKTEQYQFLLKEYNELSEAVALSFDSKVLKKVRSHLLLNQDTETNVVFDIGNSLIRQ
ncbi:hypothetical protein DFS34DRAFT_597345 [Phlyctochytrium arcticum]|nr:hypothetical protein DFS34DRAFT_597345 [Phlyctochytrium arcticum]